MCGDASAATAKVAAALRDWQRTIEALRQARDEAATLLPELTAALES